MGTSIKLMKVVLLISVLTAFSGCRLLSDHVSDDEPDTYGLWEVGHVSFTAIDSARDDRSLLVDVWYPVDADKANWGFLDKYPLLGPLGLTAEIAMMGKPVSKVHNRNLIVFSHGFGGTNTQSTPLMET